jgi:peptidoglycan/xylan/chitin deacetylase (PgdA/CDA1 family)
MRISLDADDFGPANHRMDLLQSLIVRYPKIKITLFTIPWDIRFSPDTKGAMITDEKYEGWCAAVRFYIEKGNFEIGLHGLTHAPTEFGKLTYQEAKNRILVAQKMFLNRKIPTTKLFKAPQWAISKDATKAVKDMGLQLVKDGYYNWNIKDEIPDKKNIIAHGHIQDERATMNGLDQSFIRLCKIPSNAKWKFLSEVL